jgi:hypothetical protein
VESVFIALPEASVSLLAECQRTLMESQGFPHYLRVKMGGHSYVLITLLSHESMYEWRLVWRQTATSANNTNNLSFPSPSSININQLGKLDFSLHMLVIR